MAGVVKRDSRVVGQNMDWYVVDVETNVLFDLTVADGTRMLAIGSVPYLPMAGMNSHGIAYGGNSVYSNDNRVGVPNAFVRRWVLEASSLEEAVASAHARARTWLQSLPSGPCRDASGTWRRRRVERRAWSRPRGWRTRITTSRRR